MADPFGVPGQPPIHPRAQPYGQPAQPFGQYDVGPDTQPYSVPPGALEPVSAYPAPMPVAEPIIAQIGDIQVTATRVRTPVGDFPLRGSQWMATDAWTQTSTTPTWAVVMAIVGFFCLTLFSLLFLLAKENKFAGAVQVSVISGGRSYVTRVPVSSHAHVQHIHNQVLHIRNLAAM